MTLCVGLRQYSPHDEWTNLSFLIFPHTTSVVGSVEQRMVGSSHCGHRLHRWSESCLGWARSRRSLIPHAYLSSQSLWLSPGSWGDSSWKETALPERSSLCSSHKRIPVDLMVWFTVPPEQDIMLSTQFFWSKVNFKGHIRYCRSR